MVPHNAAPRWFDVAVIGGGPAGLSAAIWAARYRRRVVLIDSHEPRNRWTAATHGYLGSEDIGPDELLASARADLIKYPEITSMHDWVTEVFRKDDEHFEIRLADAEPISAARLVVCTGVRDLFPEVEHFFDYFGTSVFTCPSCDGYEAQGKQIVIWGAGTDVTAFALSMLEWSERITLLTEPGPDAPDEDGVGELRRRGVQIVTGRPRVFEGDDGKLRSVVLDNGTSVSCDMAFLTVQHRQQADITRQLGCAESDEGCVIVDDECRTSVPGVYAAGDITPGPHLVQVAAAKGAIAGVASARSIG